MGKRKQTAPVRASADKRKCMSWNMIDGETEGSVSVISDNDPSLQQESICTADSQKSKLLNYDGSYKKGDLMEILDLHIENCEFSIPILKEPNLKAGAWSCLLGEFRVQFSPGPLFLPLPTDLPDAVSFTLYIGNEGDKSIFCYTTDEAAETPVKRKSQTKHVVRNVNFWLVDVALPVSCLEALRCRSFQVVLETFCPDSVTMAMKILGTETVLARRSCPSEAVRTKGVNQSLLTLIKHFYRVTAPDYEDLPYTRKHDIDELYAVIQQRHCLDQRPILADVQHADLLPVLRLYQQAGITWMIYKEKQNTVAKNGELHMLYTPITTKDGKTLYYNRYAGMLVRERPVSVLPSPGGILGDEMGLGKTVEVLGLILHHPRDWVPQHEALPVVKDEEIPKKVKAKGKGKGKNKIKKKKQVIIEDSDSNATIIYSDFSQSNVIDISSGLMEQLSENSDKISWSGEQCTAVLQDSVKIDSKQVKEEHNVEDRTDNGMKKDQELYKGAKKKHGVDTVVEEWSNKVFRGKTGKRDASCYKTDSLSDNTETQVCNDAGPGREACDNRVEAGASTTGGYNKNIFTEMPGTNTEEFECICGADSATSRRRRRGRKRLHPVQCVKCKLWQHAECVNYDLTDPLRGVFKCPHCHISSCPVVSGATLIISPFSIANQWVDEILKHVAKESLNVFAISNQLAEEKVIASRLSTEDVLQMMLRIRSLESEFEMQEDMYTGVNKQGFIQPQTLARQDIVITTYETLRKELDYVDLPHSNSDKGRKLRHPKRFMALPSPMVAIEWWRICLDEAQMVECTTTKTAEMALRLTAVNRWCVTGTPVQKDIDDLYGLLLFLGVDPYWVQQWWSKLVYNPYCRGVREPLHDLLTSVLWRTVKKDVLDQIDIPAQTEQLLWLTFSPVEEHFYRRQYQDCLKLSMERLSKWTDSSMKLSSLDRNTVNQLLFPLVRLRQACCHPQAVRGEFIAIQKSTMTMEELLESLTKKARLEAEESHRVLVAAINGQAGVHLIQGEVVEAVEKYREVLRSVEEQRGRLHTDTLQQLHALHNLHEVLTDPTPAPGIAPTLRDHLLHTQMEELKDKYMAKAITYVKGTEEALAPVQMDVKQLQREMNDGSEWWLEVIQWSVQRGVDDTLVMKVRDDLLDNRNPAIDTLVRSCRNYTGLQYAIELKMSGINQAYQALLKAMKGLHGPPSTKLINQATDCCLRPVAEISKTCPFCKSEELFETYEARLFSFVEKGIEQTAASAGYQVNARRQGTWADSEVEKALKSILSFAKSFKAPDDFIEFGTIHLKLLDAMKKEYRKLRTHWAGIKEHVGAFDELAMSTTRLRLRLPGEPVPETPQLNILEPSQLPQHRLKLSSDRIVAQGELRKKLGQLLYLTNLAKNAAGNKEGDNPELCPICQIELGREWSVMQCGHCFCLECIRIMAERASFGRQRFSVKCAVCRQTTYQSEISFVTTKSEVTVDGGEMRVLGSHSTKVEAIVRCLLKIKKEDPQAKSLVFSTWTDVLSVIAKALDENNITYRALYAAGKFQQSLSSFKQNDDVSTLLLPVHSGANGLNLIEATNVLLVEPILNPSQELQAIGRVHRIGQTKPTHVYRFLVRGTIEQKMHMLLKSLNTQMTAATSEESHLTIGDLSSLFCQQVEEDNREGVHSTDEADPAEPGLVEEDNREGVHSTDEADPAEPGLVEEDNREGVHSTDEADPAEPGLVEEDNREGVHSTDEADPAEPGLVEEDNREGVHSTDEADPAEPGLQPAPSTSQPSDCTVIGDNQDDDVGICDPSVNIVNEGADDFPSTSTSIFPDLIHSDISSPVSSEMSALANPVVSISTDSGISISTGPESSCCSSLSSSYTVSSLVSTRTNVSTASTSSSIFPSTSNKLSLSTSATSVSSDISEQARSSVNATCSTPSFALSSGSPADVSYKFISRPDSPKPSSSFSISPVSATENVTDVTV